MSNSVAKNTAFMTVASIAQKVISFVYFTFIANSVGVTGTEKYFLALSFTTIFVVLVDLGMTNVLVREAARVKANIQKYFSVVLSVKLFFGVAAYGLVLLVSTWLYDDQELRNMIWLSGITMLFDSLNLTVYGVLRAIGDLRFESVSITASQFLSLVLGSIFLLFHLPLIFLILAFTIPSALNTLYASYVVFHRYQVKPVPQFDKNIFFLFGKMSIPFALAAIFARVYGYIDTILLKEFGLPGAAGFYSIPYKITYAFQFIPLALMAALYPRFSEYFINKKDKLATVFHDALKYLLIIAVPVAFGVSLLAKDIVLFLYPEEFLASVLPLQILIISLIFSFLSFPIGAILNACDKQNTQTKIIGIVMAINILLNLLLIPLFNVSGAALSALVGNILLTVLGYIFIPQVAPISHARVIKNVWQVLLAGGVMGMAVWITNIFTSFFIAIPVGALSYVAMLFVTRAITKAELLEARNILRR